MLKPQHRTKGEEFQRPKPNQVRFLAFFFAGFDPSEGSAGSAGSALATAALAFGADRSLRFGATAGAGAGDGLAFGFTGGLRALQGRAVRDELNNSAKAWHDS